MSAILYDTLGPVGRRRVAVGSAVAIAGLAVVGGLAVIRLVDAGQFEGRKWSPIFNPACLDRSCASARAASGGNGLNSTCAGTACSSDQRLSLRWRARHRDSGEQRSARR